MSDWGMVLIQIAAAFAISLGYSIIYNIPKKYILIASAIGAASKLLMFFLTFRLRTNDQEIENNENKDERNKHFKG